MLIGDSSYLMGDEQAEKVAVFAVEHSRGIGALVRDGVMELVDEPYADQKVLEYMADGYEVRYRV